MNEAVEAFSEREAMLFDLAWGLVASIRGGGTLPIVSPQDRADHASPILTAMLKARNTALTKPAEGEPVAWRARNYTEEAWTLLSDRGHLHPYRRVEALYTRPVAWPDREAAVEAFRAWYFAHTGKRIYANNALKAVNTILSASDGAGGAG